jgi:hypothetical protein
LLTVPALRESEHVFGIVARVTMVVSAWRRDVLDDPASWRCHVTIFAALSNSFESDCFYGQLLIVCVLAGVQSMYKQDAGADCEVEKSAAMTCSRGSIDIRCRTLSRMREALRKAVSRVQASCMVCSPSIHIVAAAAAAAAAVVVVVVMVVVE